MLRSRTIIISVNKKTGDTFDAILQIPLKLISDAKISNDGWWSFIGPRGKSKFKFNENKSLKTLDSQFIDEESTWDIPIRVVSSGDFSEILITLNKPYNLTDMQFDQRITEIESAIDIMKTILESS
jgi:hypothetical protein